jgi:hypothetical protein
MILAMDEIHVQVTSMMANARPPRFYMGLARGVGTYFGEDLDVRKLGADRVRIRFRGKRD